MALDPKDFPLQHLIAKHGDKGKPGYELLHPKTGRLGTGWRTPKQEERLERLGGLIQSGKHEEAEALLLRLNNLAPAQRKIVAEEIKSAKLRAKPKAKPKPRAIKGMEPAKPKVTEQEADAPPMAVVTDLNFLDVPTTREDFLPPDGPDDDPGAMASRFDDWQGMIARADSTEELEVIEQDIDGMMGPGSAAYDELQDLLNAKHREHFERDRKSVQKWLAQRGIVRKHGNKGAPGYELLHPGTMLRGNRSDKQKKRLERLGSMLQDGDHEGAQALLDRTLNLSDGDRKIAQDQIGAARKGGDGGKSKEAPEHTTQGAASAPAQPKTAPDKPKPAPKAEKAPAPGPDPGPRQDEDYGDEGPVDVAAMSRDEQRDYEEGAQEAIAHANHLSELDDIEAMIQEHNLPPKMKKSLEEHFLGVQRLMLEARGGVNDLENGTHYEQPKPSIAKRYTEPKKPSRQDRNRALQREEDSSKTPAGKHLARGGGIDDAPYDGLLAYIEDNPDRFEVDESEELSASKVYFVTDNETGTQHFFKQVLNGAEIEDGNGYEAQPHIYGDGANEITAAALGRAVYPEMFLETDYAEDPTGIERPMIRQTHLGQFAPDADQINSHQRAYLIENDDEATGDMSVSLSPDAPPLADRSQVIAMHVFDYLIANTDRHSGNIASIEKDGKRHLVAIDNGSSGHSMTAGVADPNTEMSGEMDESLAAPETVPYDMWQTEWAMNPATGMRSKWLRAEAVAAYGGDTAAMLRDAEKVIADFKRVKTKQIIADLRKKYANADEYERGHMEAMIVIWENRIQMIDAADVVKVLS